MYNYMSIKWYALPISAIVKFSICLIISDFEHKF